MYAVVSLLEDVLSRQVVTIWEELEEKCGLAGIKMTPYPHFSWQVAENYDQEELKTALQAIALHSKPFEASCTGLGIFTGAAPVIYIPVVKDETLLRYHRELWEKSKPFARGLRSFYSPQHWVPHITLAHSDVDPQKLACALTDLLVQPFVWKMKIDHLAVVCQTGNEVGHLEARYDFSEEG